ncbi:alpha/beta hydrolase [Brachybacterium alimentarium]|uniref:alpha/beta hydrolase n=1 Tax=Brachybacterium alimentarium TaxID=47845 RepID=UPI003FD3127B
MTSAAVPRRPLSRITAAAAAMVLLLSGCTQLGSGSESASDGGGTDSGQEEPSGEPEHPLVDIGTSAAADLPSDPATDPDYSSYYEQDIEWGECEDVYADGIECGTLTVPLAWNDPDGKTIDLAVAQIPGTGQDDDSLVLNNGGPGVSGVNFLESAPYVFSPEVRSSYDLVGFDPRGVARSAGIECLTDEETDDYLSETVEPGEAGGDEVFDDWEKKIAESCESNSGDLLPYLDTYSAARDMDVLRAALGSEKLDYLGFSYGTYLGSSFADLYPERVGHFVLDGALDPKNTMDDFFAGRAAAFEDSADAFVQSCLDSGESCPVSGDVAEGKQQLNEFFDSVDKQPLDSGNPDRPLTGAIARSVFYMLMYSDELWDSGWDAISAAMDGDGSLLLATADQSNERLLDGSYRTNFTYAITAVNCLDHPWIADEQWQEDQAEQLAEEYPTFGAQMGDNGCGQWPVPPLREPAAITADGAAPILVIGTTHDPATPYPWAQSLAEQLDSGVLLTFEGQGHTAYGRSGGCIEEQVDAYLLEDTVPEDGFTC